MNATSTLYDVLGLPPTASEGDIHAAHMRLVRHYQNGIHGLSGAEADQRIQAIKGAWWTLSDPGRRLAYDTGLAAAQALAQAAAAASQPPAPEPSPTAPAADVIPPGVLPPLIEVELKSPKRSPLRIMLGVIGSLMIIGLILQIFFSVFAFRQVTGSGDAALEAQQRVMDAERRQTYGDLTDKEIAELERNSVLQREESRAQEEERRKEQAKKQEEYERERALRERKNYADQVSNELRPPEAFDQQKALWERHQHEAPARREHAEDDARSPQRLAR
ncbi:MAG: DnaJ domain-containing protein, partial [Zoogloea sp.]|nr:DnaJ domain-containing protein [Zoogloea sp.]